ncbi:MAG TPA: hypothetical protein DCZ94_05600 [Lentisphaeria bacterium]|nr:MAG: hypothetical protein A2X48_14945 [Lentisphaerae bacterium GWF2_49_21]HBC86410.1 hypothetical protein [Lentisphaeria bacterium]
MNLPYKEIKGALACFDYAALETDSTGLAGKIINQMIKSLTGKWSAYISGTALAFLFMLALYLFDTTIGMSDSYIMISDYCKQSINRRAVNEFPPFDWHTGFLAGIFLGAMIAAIIGGEWRFRLVPEDIKEKGVFGSLGLAMLQGVAGGFLVMLGLQISGDSFEGQLSSAMQLSTGAWIFLAAFVVWGVIFMGIHNMVSAGGGKKSSGSKGEKAGKGKDKE